jgi:hypothetical protein
MQLRLTNSNIPEDSVCTAEELILSYADRLARRLHTQIGIQLRSISRPRIAIIGDAPDEFLLWLAGVSPTGNPLSKGRCWNHQTLLDQLEQQSLVVDRVTTNNRFTNRVELFHLTDVKDPSLLKWINDTSDLVILIVKAHHMIHKELDYILPFNQLELAGDKILLVCTNIEAFKAEQDQTRYMIQITQRIQSSKLKLRKSSLVRFPSPVNSEPEFQESLNELRAEISGLILESSRSNLAVFLKELDAVESKLKGYALCVCV